MKTNVLNKIWKFIKEEANRPMRPGEEAFGLPPKEKCPNCGHRFWKDSSGGRCGPM